MSASMYDLMKSGISYEELLEDLNRAKSEIDKERTAASKEKLRLAEAFMQNIFDYIKIDNPELDLEMTDAERKMLAGAFMSLMDGAVGEFETKTETKPTADPIDAFLRELNLK